MSKNCGFYCSEYNLKKLIRLIFKKHRSCPPKCFTCSVLHTSTCRTTDAASVCVQFFLKHPRLVSKNGNISAGLAGKAISLLTASANSSAVTEPNVLSVCFGPSACTVFWDGWKLSYDSFSERGWPASRRWQPAVALSGALLASDTTTQRAHSRACGGEFNARWRLARVTAALAVKGGLKSPDICMFLFVTSSEVSHVFRVILDLVDLCFRINNLEFWAKGFWSAKTSNSHENVLFCPLSSLQLQSMSPDSELHWTKSRGGFFQESKRPPHLKLRFYYCFIQN